MSTGELQGDMKRCWRVTCDGLASLAFSGSGIPLIASCLRNRNELVKLNITCRVFKPVKIHSSLIVDCDLSKNSANAYKGSAFHQRPRKEKATFVSQVNNYKRACTSGYSPFNWPTTTL